MNHREDKKIFIVEDQRLIAADLENTLKKLGYAVAGLALSGEEAIEKIAASGPALVLMDIRLQGKLDGIQTAAIVRERFDIPVVYLTAYADEETIHRATMTAPFGYIVKPFNERELRAAIEVALYKNEMERLLSAERAQRKAADELKLEALGQLHDLIEQAPDGILVAGPDGRLTEVNRAGCQMLGYTREELVGEPFIALLPPEDAGRLSRAEEQLLRGESHVAEWALRRKDGTYLQAEVSAKLLRDGRWQGVVRDISGRKSSEDEQRFLAEVGTVLMTAASDYESTLTDIARLVVREMADWCIIDVVRGRQIQRLRVIHWDPAMAAVCAEFERIQIDRQRPHLMSVVLEARRPHLMSEVPPGYLESIAQSAEHLRMLHVLGPKSLIAVPLIARGQFLGALALLSSRPSRRYDTRDLHRAEELASRAALAMDNAYLYGTAQRAIQARDEVLGIVAHDLRNPLNTVVMQAQLLRQRAGPERSGQKPLEAITRAASRMDRLIQDMLDVARLEGAPLSIQRGSVPLRRALEEAVEAQRMAASSASLELLLDVTDDLPDVLADHDRLLQVFDNLIGNAIKFATLDTRIIVGAVPKEGEVVLWVADSGAGIPAEQLPHLFDRLWQARTTDRRGAGLGLPIVKGIVEAHGGRVWVESQVGVGTTFYFTLPAGHRAEAPPSGPPPSA